MHTDSFTFFNLFSSAKSSHTNVIKTPVTVHWIFWYGRKFDYSSDCNANLGPLLVTCDACSYYRTIFV